MSAPFLWLWRAIGAISTVLGVVGMPDQLQQWWSVLQPFTPYIDNGWFRIALIAIGLALILMTLWRRHHTPALAGNAPVVGSRDPIYVPISEVFDQIIAASDDDPIRAAVALDKALQSGELRARGRPFGSLDREQIPQDYWHVATLRLHDLLMPEIRYVETAPRIVGGGFRHYEDVFLDLTDVRRLWPDRR